MEPTERKDNKGCKVSLESLANLAHWVNVEFADQKVHEEIVELKVNPVRLEH